MSMPKAGDRAPSFSAADDAGSTVSLKDFNVQGAKGFVGSKVGETINVTAKLFGSTGN